MNLEPMSLILTLLDPNLDSNLYVFACPEVYLVLDSRLPAICYHDISNGMSDWVLIPSAIETHTGHGHGNNNDNVQGKYLSAPLV